MPTRLDAAYDAQVAQVRTKILSYAERMWNGLPAYREADAERLIAAIVPRVEAAQLRIGQLTDAYIARTAAQQFGTSISRGSIADVTTQALRGVAAEDVYRRPFATVYNDLSNGKTLTESVTSGGVRLASLVATGMQLAKTHSARQAINRSGATLFRRVLTGREDCGLCVIASTQRYHRGNLMPIHPGCDCHVASFKGDPDEQVIDPDLLNQMHSGVEAEFGFSDRGARLLDGLNDRSDYLDLITTYEHGELGPTLAWRGQHIDRLDLTH